MHKDTPKRAFAARDAHEALLGLKRLLDEAAIATHAAELEAFHLAVGNEGCDELRFTLERIAAQLWSPDFDAKLSRARETLETAISLCSTGQVCSDGPGEPAPSPGDP